MELMALVGESEISAIETRIPNIAYRRNFLALAKRIAPDGERVRQVGFTVLRSGSERSVEMLIPRSRIPTQPTGVLLEGDHRSITLTGTLRYADATSEEHNTIRVIDEGGQSHTIEVPTGMMNDIVRPMWDSRVKITGSAFDVVQPAPLSSRTLARLQPTRLKDSPRARRADRGTITVSHFSPTQMIGD